MQYITVVLTPGQQAPRQLTYVNKKGELLVSPDNLQHLRLPRYAVTGGYVDEQDSYAVEKINASLALSQVQLQSMLVFSYGSEFYRAQLGWNHHPPTTVLAAISMSFTGRDCTKIDVILDGPELSITFTKDR
jgi:hypothetical protein